jgi:hypothetical protein
MSFKGYMGYKGYIRCMGYMSYKGGRLRRGCTFAALLAAAVFVAGCSQQAKEQAAPAAAEKHGEPEPRVKHGTNGEVIVTLDAATQKIMGLQVAPLAPAQLSPQVKGYGRVLDATPLAATVADLAVAEAASANSQVELKRLKTLAAENNASERALQAAEAAAVRDRVQAESARLKLVANWGSAIAVQQDLPAFVRSLSSLGSALVEIDLPAGESINAAPTAARLLSLAQATQPIEARFLGPATMADPQMQGRGFLFLVDPNPSRLVPGAAVEAFLILPGAPQPGVLLPREAIVRFNGATWAYLQTAGEAFQRVEVALDKPLEAGWFVRDGLKAQDKVVTTGAQQLLSEELKGQAAE